MRPGRDDGSGVEGGGRECLERERRTGAINLRITSLSDFPHMLVLLSTQESASLESWGGHSTLPTFIQTWWVPRRKLILHLFSENMDGYRNCNQQHFYCSPLSGVNTPDVTSTRVVGNGNHDHPIPQSICSQYSHVCLEW